MDWYAAEKLEYEHERLPKYDNDEERRRVPFENYYDPEQCPWSLPSATSSAILGSANTVASPEAATEHSQLPEAATGIPEAATEHSEIQRLLMLANAASPEVATEHFQIPEAATAIPEAKLTKKSRKETFLCQEATRPWKKGKGTGSHKRETSPNPKDIAG